MRAEKKKLGSWKLPLLLGLVVFVLAGPGCASVQRGIDRAQEWWDAQRGKDSGAEQPVPDGFPPGLVWLGPDVSGWAVSSRLEGVGFVGTQIHMPYDAARRWPVTRYEAGGPDIVGNPWVVFELGGVWYAATWEWMRPGQTSKARAAVAGDHIKRGEVPSSWRPAPGQEIGIFLSAPARGNARTVSERTNVVWTRWP